MKIGFLITARLKSTRLPFKILLDLKGKTVIERIIDRAKNIEKIDDIILCTSTNKQDSPLIKIAKKNNIYYYLGSEEDVLKRLLNACEYFDLDGFIGITADNPLFSVYYSKILVDSGMQSDADFIYLEGLPLGTATYYMKTKALKTVCEVKEIIDTEIWGHLINRPEIFKVEKIKAADFLNKKYRLTLDTSEDYETINMIYKNINFDNYLNLFDVISYLDNNPDVIKNFNVIQRELPKDILIKIDDFYKKKKDEIIDIKNKIYSEHSD